MRFRTALSLATLFLFCFAVAVWSTPLDVQASVRTNPGAEMQTVSGKIASVGDAEFALEVKEGQKQNALKFLVDGNTKVEGKLSIGAQATVEYRSEDGRNIATRVSVMPASGIQSH
ncbi:MAG: hypothetical protein WBL63_09600 [Candidatus Acidiferrum sp.]